MVKIKHKKASTDAQKSKLFSKMSKLLAQEARQTKGNKDSPSLRSAIEQARSINMPSSKIEQAIQSSEKNEESLMAATYEAYGPGGCGLLIETNTDNKNRTAAEIRHILNKYGSSVSAPGSASWMFLREGEVIKPKTTVTLTQEEIKKLEDLLNELSEQQDVESVYSNKAD